MDGRWSRSGAAFVGCLIAAGIGGCGGDDAGGGALRDGGRFGDDAGPRADGGDAPDGGPGGAIDGGPGGGADGGGGADAGPGASPAATGPFGVTTADDTVASAGRSVPVFVHLPSRAGRSPLVVFHPGFQVRSAAYGALADHVASHGFVVVRAEPPSNYDLFGSSHVEGAADLSAVIGWALATHPDAIDPAAIAVSGHSAGGKIATMVANDDDRVTALVTLDPVNGAGGPGSGYSADRPDVVPDAVAPLTIPVGFLGETTDGSGGFMPCAPADQGYVTFYEAATSAPWAAEWTFDGARHMDFLTGPGSCGTACFACAQSAMAAAVAAKATTLVTAFLRRHLAGDLAMEAWLTGASVPAGVTTRSR